MLDRTQMRPVTVSFQRLGFQCPYALWFRDQARQFASELGLAFDDIDLSGQPEAAACHGAYCSMQIKAPGAPLSGAPRPVPVLVEQYRAGSQDGDCVAGDLTEQVQADCVTAYQPDTPGWPEAIDASARLCFNARISDARVTEGAAAKLGWLASLAAGEAQLNPQLFLAGTTAAPRGFAELIPLSAAHVPVPFHGQRDMYLTCIHAGSNPEGDVRLDLLRKVLASLEPVPPLFPGVSGVWAVCGFAASYPNGPLELFLRAGFREIARLGKIHLPGRGVDRLVLVHWEPQASARDTGPVGILVHPDDNVVTVPEGAQAQALISVRGMAQAIALHAEVPAGHKVAVRAISAGDTVVKYGQAIGIAVADIQRGEHVHIHNMVSGRAGGVGLTERGTSR